MLGGGRAAYAGLPEAVDSAFPVLPEGAVVYHPTSLGWPLAYYAVDPPVYLAAYDRPATLAADLRAYAHPGDVRALLLRACESSAEPLRAVEAAGLRAEVMWRPASEAGCPVVLYTLELP